jgi:hypothetical protein
VSDEFLSRLSEDPRPEFAEGLERRLREIDAEHDREASGGRLRPALVGAIAVAAVAVAFTLPPVRAAARDFLDLFRVQRFAAVPVDTERLSRLEQGGVDLRGLVGTQVEVIEPAVEPEPVESAALASARAGIDVLEPAALPEGAKPAGIAVARPAAFRVRLDVAKLRGLAEALGVEDAAVPPQWDGATVEVHAPPVVAMQYRRGDSEFVLMQSRGPEVALPEAVDLSELGALGLQMAGMSAAEARLFARRIDWRSTLLVPIPARGSSFREVEVRGRKGLLVTARRSAKETDGRPQQGRWHSVLLWADEDRVYAAAGPGHGIELLEMAQSIG